MKLRYTNPNGFSLVEAMLGVAFLGIITLGGASLLSTFFSQQSIGREQEAVNNLKLSLSEYFKNENNCNSVLADSLNINTISGSSSTINKIKLPRIGGNNFPLDIPSLVKNNEKMTSISAGTHFSPHLQIKEITAQSIPLEASASMPATVLGGTRYIPRTVRIEVDFERASASNMKIGTIPRDIQIEIPVLVDASGMVKGCQSNINQELSCNAIGGVWNGTTCNPGFQCRHMGGYISYTCSRGAACAPFNAGPNPLTGDSSCPTPSTRTLTFQEVRYSHTESCGKKCSVDVTTGLFYYTCLHCN